MRTRSALALLAWLAACTHTASQTPATTTQPPPRTEPAAVVPTIMWQQHDEARPQPRIARPAAAVVVRPPADVTILFDGTSLSAWTDSKGNAPAWKLANGYLEVVPGAGDIRTRAAFGDVQLHLEWAAPLPPEGEGQQRGNSGVFLMGTYEVQVLDSYGNQTYPDGQAGALYGQYPPLVNASLPPGEWQSYDIVFHGPRFAGDRVVQPARFTVIHNGVLIQDNVSLVGPTSHGRRDPYTAHADQLPLSLQDHGQAVRYRNIWIRELSGE